MIVLFRIFRESDQLSLPSFVLAQDTLRFEFGLVYPRRLRKDKAVCVPCVSFTASSSHVDFTMKQQPRFGAIGWIATRIHHLLPVDALRLSTHAGTFFICWGDETLNMIVMDQVLRSLYMPRWSERL
uniref:Uncharacterized protein n=1 Tax=Candidatus Kentrum sp. LPFa TaxID=2126335 RepID=A0A450W261_9GAMM|nr:MAG: hypothetical protein BECKLPF1236B_GA0070989_102027 [Candidatus Kentron sp. LPFa]